MQKESISELLIYLSSSSALNNTIYVKHKHSILDTQQNIMLEFKLWRCHLLVVFPPTCFVFVNYHSWLICCQGALAKWHKYMPGLWDYNIVCILYINWYVVWFENVFIILGNYGNSDCQNGACSCYTPTALLTSTYGSTNNYVLFLNYHNK